MKSNHRNILKMLLVGMAALIVMTGTAWAENYSATIGAVTAPDYEGSENYTLIPALLLRGNYDNGLFFSLGANFKANLVPSKTFTFGPILNYRPERDDIKNNNVDSLDKIHAAFEAGVFTSYAINNFSLGLEVLTDVSNEHKGSLVKPSVSYHWQAMSKLMFTSTAFTTYADNNYMDTYFSIDANNRGSSTLPNFNADGGIKDVGINIVAHYRTPWPQWGIMGTLGYSSLLNDARNSPIVDQEGDNNQMFLGLMANYRWDI